MINRYASTKILELRNKIKKLQTNAAVVIGVNTTDVTLGTSNGLTLVGQVLSMLVATATQQGVISLVAQVLGDGVKTFKDDVRIGTGVAIKKIIFNSSGTDDSSLFTNGGYLHVGGAVGSLAVDSGGLLLANTSVAGNVLGTTLTTTAAFTASNFSGTFSGTSSGTNTGNEVDADATHAGRITLGAQTLGTGTKTMDAAVLTGASTMGGVALLSQTNTVAGITNKTFTSPTINAATTTGTIATGTTTFSGTPTFPGTVFFTGHTTQGTATVPSQHTSTGYKSIWFEGLGTMTGEVSTNFANITQATNRARDTVSNWVQIDATKPTWWWIMGHGSSVDYFRIGRTAAGGNCNTVTAAAAVIGADNAGVLTNLGVTVLNQTNTVTGITNKSFTSLTHSGTMALGTSTVSGTPAFTGVATFGAQNVYFAQNTITAFATGGQASATALTGAVCFVTTVASANDSVKLPVTVAGKPVVVFNLGANSVRIFPQTGGAIDALGTNNGYDLAAGGVKEFWTQTTTQWRSK